MPAPLPPDPPIDLDGSGLQRALSDADRALGVLNGSLWTLPSPDLFANMYIRKEAVLSSRIEGTRSSLEDVLAAEAEIPKPDSPGDIQEVLNWVRASRQTLTRLEQGEPLDMRLICDAHRELMQDVRGGEKSPGQIRTVQNYIVSSATRRPIYVPPPPEALPDCLSDLERFLSDAANSDLPLLVTIGLAHPQFENIHPFRDGNGRTGRLLINLMLCRHGALQQPVLYLSHYLLQHQREYYDRLRAIHEEGAWEQWLDFFLRGVAEVSEQATDTVREILRMREQHRQLITDHFGRAAASGYRLLDSLYSQPMVSVHRVRQITGTQYAAANNLVARLTTVGILHPWGPERARNRIFSYQPYIDLFN